jgi:hypothetical protein
MISCLFREYPILHFPSNSQTAPHARVLVQSVELWNCNQTASMQATGKGQGDVKVLLKLEASEASQVILAQRKQPRFGIGKVTLGMRVLS